MCVLTGRCYEREAVPYKAFDGVVDSLTRFLLHAPIADVRSFLPTKPAPLVQVFPVLRAGRRDRPGDDAAAPPMDPQELRDRAFSALRELLTRLATHQPVVIAIDDVQWADADSIALLGDVLRPPEAPPLLFIGTERTGGGPDARHARRVAAVGRAPARSSAIDPRRGARGAPRSPAVRRGARARAVRARALRRERLGERGVDRRGGRRSSALHRRARPLQRAARGGRPRRGAPRRCARRADRAPRAGRAAHPRAARDVERAGRAGRPGHRRRARVPIRSRGRSRSCALRSS